MEGGEVIVSRASGSVKFPSRFMLVGAMNPCPCGNYGDDSKACICTTQAVYKYQKKISGPVLDRIDIQINVPRETYEKLSGKATGPSNKETREIVAEARRKQLKRFHGTAAQTNSDMGPKEITKFCILDRGAENLIKAAVTTHNLSGRSYHKILKIARTIADLDNKENVETGHIAEAISYRIKQENSGLV
jgi:magnesium chelatase family protein